MVNTIGSALVSALGIVCCLTDARAADEMQFVELIEEVRTEPRVTAEAVLVGLVRAPAPDTARDGAVPILAQMPPEHRADGICVRVTTADGLYSGQGRYADPGGGAEAAALMVYRPEKKQLANYGDADIAVLTFPCDQSGGLGRIAVATWRADGGAATEAAPDERADLLVNSFRADEVFVTLDDGNTVACSPQPDGTRAAFDFRCALPVAALQSGPRLSLHRVRGASMDAEVTVRVIGWP